MRRLLSIVVVGALGLPALGVSASTRTPLGYTAYDGWKTVRTPVLADDASCIAYVLAPEDGDGELVVRDLRAGTDLHEERGAAPHITADGRFVIYTVMPHKADIDAARRAKKRADDGPLSGAAVLDRSTGTVVARYDRVKAIVAPRLGADVVAFHLAGDEPAPSPSPAADIKHKERGSALIVRDLRAGTQSSIADVTGATYSSDGAWLAYTVEALDGATDGAYALELATGKTYTLASGPGRYANLAFARSSPVLGFLSDRDTYMQSAPSFALYTWNGAVPQTAALSVVNAQSRGMPGGWAPSTNGTVHLTDDGRRAYFGTASIPVPAPSTTPEPMKVDIWTWHDDVLQPAQKVRAERERKRTFGATVDLGTGGFVQIATPAMPDVQTVQSGRFALASGDVPYRRASSWSEDTVDSELVDLTSGARRRAVTRARVVPELSPGGRFVLGWDERAGRWYAIDTNNLHTVVLAPSAKVSFRNELWDTPTRAEPYRLPGVAITNALGQPIGSVRPGPFSDDDRWVVLADRYDLWRVDPTSGAATMLTRGLGRATHRNFAIVDVDPAEHPGIDLATPQLLASRDERTMATGLWSLRPLGAPTKLIERDAQIGPFMFVGRASVPIVRAAHSDTIAFTIQRFDQVPNLWTATSTLANLTRISDADPQFDRYSWGRNRLIDYTTTDGKPMRALLTLPADFDPKKKYPMLVYFYERLTDTMHAFTAPAPGTGPNFARYASTGYVVLRPDISYTIGHPGASALHHVMGAVDAVVKMGFVDPTRIGLSGHSWGAYQIAYIITHTNRFRAVEAGAAVANMTSAYGGIRWESGIVRESQYEIGQSRLGVGATPWDRPDLYLENSALFHIRSIQTPYLTIHNDEDGAVPWYQGIEFFTALRRLNKEAYLFVYNGEDHNLRGREQQKHWTVHLDEYFDHFLRGAPTPSWMVHGVDYLHKGERSVRALYGEPES